MLGCRVTVQLGPASLKGIRSDGSRTRIKFRVWMYTMYMMYKMYKTYVHTICKVHESICTRTANIGYSAIIRIIYTFTIAILSILDEI